MKSVRMLFSPPLLSFIVGIAFVVLSIPIPHFVAATVKSFGSVTSPLALFFIGMTIFKIGVSEMKRMPRELVFVLLSCFVIRPLVMYLVTIPFDLEPIMRKVFVAAAALPVSSVIAVLARTYGGDERFASRAIGVTTLGIIPALPVMLFGSSSKTPVAKSDGTKMFCSAFLNDARMCCFFCQYNSKILT